MPRPHKRRRIRGNPHATYFKPAGIPARTLEQVNLSLAEFEALRLKDFEGLEQSICAEHMQISQPTFHRLLLIARKKIAEALVGGKSIGIEKQGSSKQEL